MGVPEGEEEEQEIDNLFEQIMKENFPNLPKELDMLVQEVRRVQKKLDTPRHIIIKLPKINDKNIILKAASGKERVTYKGLPIRLSADFSKKQKQKQKQKLAGKKELERSTQSHERQGPTSKITLSSKAII